MTVGPMIADARRAAGMSTADLAAATRIRQSVVEAMEQDDFSACGGDAYAKGQLRSIARALGTDPERFVDAFLGRTAVPESAADPAATEAGGAAAAGAATSARPTSPAHAAPARPAPRTVPTKTVTSTPTSGTRDKSSARALAALGTGSSDSRGGGFNWTAAMALAVVAVLVVGLVSFLGRDRGGSGQVPVAAPTTSSAQPVATPSATPTASAVTPTQTPSDAVAVVPTGGVSVTVTVTGDKSWLTVSKGKGGERLYDGLVTTGDVKTFTADKKIRLVIGNSGAVSLTVNGKDIGEPAGVGRVSKLEFGPGDPAAA